MHEISHSEIEIGSRQSNGKNMQEITNTEDSQDSSKEESNELDDNLHDLLMDIDDISDISCNSGSYQN